VADVDRFVAKAFEDLPSDDRVDLVRESQERSSCVTCEMIWTKMKGETDQRRKTDLVVINLTRESKKSRDRGICVSS
jgi:hypothetical protein